MHYELRILHLFFRQGIQKSIIHYEFIVFIPFFLGGVQKNQLSNLNLYFLKLFTLAECIQMNYHC